MSDDILEEFFIDTISHLEAIEEDLLKLEHDAKQSDYIDDIFRRVHSIKGNAGVLGLTVIYEEGQSFESFLEGVRERRVATPAEMDQMFTGIDKLKAKVYEEKGEPVTQAVAGDDPQDSQVKAQPDIAVVSEEKSPPKSAPAPKQAPTVAPKPAQPKIAVDVEKAKASQLTEDITTFLIFDLAGEKYGIEIMRIREIILIEPITPVPNTLDFVTGVMNLRDQVIPVLDLRKKLTIPPDEGAGLERNVIVVEIENTVTGLRVDEVTGIMGIQKEKISPTELFQGSAANDYLHGIANTGEGAVILLDASRLCAPDELLF